MRQFILFALTLLIVSLADIPRAAALSDAESKKMFTKLVHAYYESDADTFWEICSKFEKPLFDSREDISRWMKERLALQDTFIKIKGALVTGKARITSEKVGLIEFRFDGSEKAPSRVIVVTAWIKRIIEFDEPVPSERRKIDQEAILKIYATIIEERLINFKSDEINFGYTFANRE